MVRLLGRLSLPWLLVGFVVGFIATWLIEPKRRIVVEFPSPYNVGLITYASTPTSKVRNGAGCFKYRANIVTCPKDDSSVSDQPMQAETFDAMYLSDGCPSAASMFLQDGIDELSPLNPAMIAC